MNSPANVSRSEAIERFRAALVEFAEQCRDGIDQLEQEVRRVLDWLDHDRPQYWQQRIREAQGEVHRAKLELERCLMFRVNEEQPSCHEERARLRKAQAVLETAQAKAEAVRHWRREIHHEHFEYQGRMGRLSQVLEGDVAQAVALLARILDSLEGYRATRSMGPTEYTEKQEGDEAS